MSHSSSPGNDSQPPKFHPILYLVMILALGLMTAYATMWDKPDPEKVVTHFWTAYFAKDYPTVLNNLSVLFLVQASPNDVNKNFSDLMTMRPALESAALGPIEKMREGGEQPAKPKVKILSQYTQNGQYGALVFFNVLDEDKTLATQVAFLIYEGKDLKILEFGMASEEALQKIKPEELKAMLAEYETLLQRITSNSNMQEPQIKVQKVE